MIDHHKELLAKVALVTAKLKTVHAMKNLVKITENNVYEEFDALMDEYEEKGMIKNSRDNPEEFTEYFEMVRKMEEAGK